MVVPLAQKSGRICTVQIILQPIPFKSDRLLAKTRRWKQKCLKYPALARVFLLKFIDCATGLYVRCGQYIQHGGGFGIGNAGEISGAILHLKRRDHTDNGLIHFIVLRQQRRLPGLWDRIDSVG